jgi:hypothetical protein
LFSSAKNWYPCENAEKSHLFFISFASVAKRKSMLGESALRLMLNVIESAICPQITV